MLIKGEDEPIYLPADENQPHNTLIFAHGFFASALHETAHWLIAGKERRTKTDFGYWYVPDGRSNEQQTLFESVEIKPQALEWILSEAAGFRFRLSVDNLNGEESDLSTFKNAVYNQVKEYCEKGLPKRAAVFRNALCQFYCTSIDLSFENFDFERLT